MQKKNKPPILTIAIIIIVLIVFLSCCFFSSFLVISWAGSVGSSASGKVIEDGKRDQQIAVVEVEGVITSTPVAAGFFSSEMEDMVTTTIKKLDKAENDKNVKAVILKINSPGGEVYGSQLIYNKVKEVKAEKPVITLMEDTAASGGYYIAAPTNKIVAANSTITGSIGVIFQLTDLEGLYEKLGIKMISVTNSEGEFKSLEGSDLADKNSGGYKILESIADDTYNEFVQAIVDGRGMTREEVVNVANGSVYSGIKAKELGLVDEIGYMDKAIEVASDEAGLDDPKVYIVSSEMSYFGNLDSRFGVALKPFQKITGTDQQMGEIKAMFILPY